MATKRTTKKTTTKRSTTRKTGSKSTARQGTRARAATTKRASATRMASRRRGSGQGTTTTDHAEIRRWVEERGGYPATVIGTERNNDEAGVLRIDYPGYSGEGRLERISWDEFFDKFDQANLAFLYQDETKGGGPSRFSKLIRRNQTRRRNNA